MLFYAFPLIALCLRVSETLEALGWKRTLDKYDERFKLKWVELKGTINYSAFKEGRPRYSLRATYIFDMNKRTL